MAIELIEDKVPELAQRPMLTPSIFAVIGSAVTYFGGKDLHAVGYGILGASGADLGSQLVTKVRENSSEDESMEGSTSRVNSMNAIEKIDRRLNILKSTPTATSCECEEPVIEESLEVATAREPEFDTIREDNIGYDPYMEAGDGMSNWGNC